MPPLNTLASQLKHNTTACRVSFEWLGTRKTLERHQRTEAAKPFGADPNHISGSKKTIDTKHPAFAKLTSLKNEAVAYWKANTLPYTEDGIRLLQKQKVQEFNKTMADYAAFVEEAAHQADEHYDELKPKSKLGSLYSEADYPPSLKGAFKLTWDFPSTEPPEYLAQLAPSIYEQEKAKVQAKMQEAVALAEQAFLTELKELIDHLHEKLTPAKDGTKKTFRDSSVKNLAEFFEKFKQLNIGSNADLDKLVEEAQGLIKGIDPQELRDHDLLRKEIAGGLSTIGAKLEPLVQNLPRRKIIKPTVENGNANSTAA